MSDRITVPDRAQPPAALTYAYTGSGDLARVQGPSNGSPAAARYTYDERHRLTNATGANGSTGAFTCSASGNLLTARVAWNGSSETRNVRYEYRLQDPQGAQRLVNLGDAVTYAQSGYDPARNMNGRSTASGNQTLTWESLDRLRIVRTAAGRRGVLLRPQGARVLAISQAEGVRAWFAESETQFSTSGVQTRRYVHLASGGSAGARVQNDARIELQNADARQNLILALVAQGRVLASFLYGPFGDVVQATGCAAEHRRQCNGRENDTVTGPQYYGLRSYDALAVRWNSADPLYRSIPDPGVTEPQRLDLDAFSLNNPVRYDDGVARQHQPQTWLQPG